jgi:hypothetical protein
MVVAPRFQSSRSASTIRGNQGKLAIDVRVAKRALRGYISRVNIISEKTRVV